MMIALIAECSDRNVDFAVNLDDALRENLDGLDRRLVLVMP